MLVLVLYVSGGAAILAGVMIFVGGLFSGVTLEATRSSAALSRTITRHLAEVRRLQEELKVLRSQLRNREK